MRSIKFWAFIISAKMLTALAYLSLHLCNLSAHLTNRLMDATPIMRPPPKAKGRNGKAVKRAY